MRDKLTWLLVSTALITSTPLLITPSPWLYATGIPDTERLIQLRLLGAVSFVLLMGCYVATKGFGPSDNFVRIIRISIGAFGAAGLAFLYFASIASFDSRYFPAQAFVWLFAMCAWLIVRHLWQVQSKYSLRDRHRLTDVR
jgi:hypothetical protein